MTRSSTNELFTPYKEPEREFQSSRRHFKNLSLDELRSPDFNLHSDQEYSKEEEAEAMAETMEQLQMLKWPSKKWQNTKGRSTETSDGLAAIQAQLNNLGREIKKVNKKFFAAQEGLGGLEQTAPGYYQRQRKSRNNANPSYQERRQSMEDTLSKFMSESAKRHEENSNLIKDIRAATYAVIRNQGASIKTLEIQIGQMSKNIILLYKSRQTTVPFLSHLDNHYCEEEEGNYGPKFAEAYGASHINDTIPRKEKDPGSFTLPCYINNVCFDNALVDLGASVSVMPLLTYLNLGLGELAHTRLTVELADRTVKYPKGIAENVLVGIGKFTFPVDFIILDMPEDIKVPLILGRPFLSTARAKIDVYKRKITLREDEVIEEFRTRDEDLDTRINDYPSYCDDDKKIHIDCAHNLKFSCMIGFEFTHVNFFSLLYINVMSKKFHNSIMKDKMVYKGDNVVGALMIVPIFVGTFSVVTDFAVLEDMDAYHDEGMGDVIFGEPFLRDVGIKARRFDGTITIYNGNDEVTYQMVRSHPRFKNHTNEKCNKIPPLLKVSEVDKMNGISHAYQKLKGFYKGVLNLGPDYI
ncbi:hypothetical protein Tco_1533508 [Tanacetum coccineum]